MADNKTYEIIIRYDPESGQAPAAQTTPSASAPVATHKAAQPMSPQKDFSQYIIAKSIQPYAMQSINYQVSTVGLTTGSTELQQKVDLARSGVETIIGGYVSAKAGAAMAAGFGMSTGAGAAVAVALYAAGKVVDYCFKAAKQNLDKADEAEQLATARTRAGIAYNQRGE
jgi:hypothetical protein